MSMQGLWRRPFMKGAQSRIKQQGRLKTRFRRPYFKQSRFICSLRLEFAEYRRFLL